MLISSCVVSNARLAHSSQHTPAGRIAFDSSIIFVARSGARTDGLAWGTARLKLDRAAMSLAMLCSLQSICADIKFRVMFATTRTLARER